VGEEPIDLGRNRMRLTQPSPQTVPLALYLLIFGLVKKPFQEIHDVVLTVTERDTHPSSPVRYDGLDGTQSYSAIQHLIVCLLQATHNTGTMLPTTTTKSVLLKPLQHRWRTN